MSVYLRKFATQAAYEAAQSSLMLPNVSLIDETNGVEYNQSSPEPPSDPRLIATFNVTSTSESTKIMNEYAESLFSAIEIDGVAQPSVVSAYTFSTTGEHTVKYTLTDPTSIGNSTFWQCSGLTSIVIPNSVTSIDDYAFYECSSLTSVTIPSSVTNIDNYVFQDCTSLTSINIPNSVTSIGSDAFWNCDSLTSVTIPDSVTSIGNSAFEYTPWWNSYSTDTSHHYGNIIYINYVAYKATATTITSAMFKSGTISISKYAFNGCSSLTSIDIPDSVTSIDDYVFSGCSSITSCTIGSGVTSIGYDAFRGCSALTSISIPDSVTIISGDAFYNCTSLTSCTIGNGVTRIGEAAFAWCSGLTSCTIGSGVTSIGTDAFRGCSALTSIISNATTAPIITKNTFTSVKTGGTLTVPSGSSGYDVWMGTGKNYLGYYNWTKVEQ